MQGVPSNSENYKINKSFKSYASCFNNLVKTKNVVTKFPLVSVMITNNSKYVITVTKEDDTMSYVKMYELGSYNLAFEEKVGCPNSYIKCKDVEQDDTGTKFALAYLNDGNYRIRVFTDKQRDDQDEILKEELDINKELDINNHTMPVDNFPDPFVTCTFCKDDFLFVNFSYSATGMHHHFVWNCVTRAITNHQTIQLDHNPENFPYKCFYSIE